MKAVPAVMTVALALIVGACGGDDESSGGGGESVKAPEGPKAATEIGPGEGEVNLIAWAGYVEDGSTDPKVDWVSDFEEQTGCQVNVKVGNTSDEMVTLMRTGQYDGVSASGDASLRLIAAGDVAPVNLELIPNYENVFEGLKNQPHNTVDDVPYGATVSYGEIAARIGASRPAVRAVGGAIGANPLLIVRPCHRVIGSDGSLTGYAGGLERKVRLLSHEGALRP